MARQGELFPAALTALGPAALPAQSLPLLRGQLLAWQEQIARFQAPRFQEQAASPQQGSLLGDTTDPALRNPLRLRPQSLQFWRWPEAPQHGAALYFVIDHEPSAPGPLLLYVGETGEAGRRWKGEHDCKTYLSAYSEALAGAGLPSRLRIHFDLDAPAAVRPRRALEQALIRHWQPPFNKETRDRWATPFTADRPS